MSQLTDPTLFPSAARRANAPAEENSTGAYTCGRGVSLVSASSFNQADLRPPLFERLRGHGLLVMETAADAKRSGQNDGASYENTHGSVPHRFFEFSRNYSQF